MASPKNIENVMDPEDRRLLEAIAVKLSGSDGIYVRISVEIRFHEDSMDLVATGFQNVYEETLAPSKWSLTTEQLQRVSRPVFSRIEDAVIVTVTETAAYKRLRSMELRVAQRRAPAGAPEDGEAARTAKRVCIAADGDA